jgi:hypothetical protein
VVAVGELARDVELLPRDAGDDDRLPHPPLGAVRLSGVNVPIAGLEGQADDLGGPVTIGPSHLTVRLYVKRTEAELGIAVRSFRVIVGMESCAVCSICLSRSLEKPSEGRRTFDDRENQ